MKVSDGRARFSNSTASGNEAAESAPVGEDFDFAHVAAQWQLQPRNNAR